MDLMDLLQGPVGQMVAEGVSSQLGKDKSLSQSALQAAIPMLMGALKKNASDPDKAKGLFEALMNKHDGSLLDNVMDIFGGGSVNEEVVEDGDKILGHVFGEKKEVAATALAKQTGLDLGSAMDILKMAAPVVMGYLGKQARSTQVQQPTDLSNIIGNVLGSHQEAAQHASLMERLLDQDGDGSIIDDLFNMGRKFFGK